MSVATGEAAGEILLVGCGKMGGALLQGWLERGSARHFVIVDPGPGAARFAGRPEVTVIAMRRRSTSICARPWSSSPSSRR